MSLLTNFFDNLGDWFVDLWDRIKAIAKWIYTHLVRFWENVVSFFKRTSRKYNRPDIKAISLKVNDLLQDETKYNTINLGLRNNYGVMNAWFDQSTGTLLEDDIEIIDGEALDKDTKEAFGNKSVIIIE